LVALALAFALVVAPMLASASPTSAVAPRHAVPAASPSGTSIASFALGYVGYRYAYVGDTPSTGFSCTGFVHWVFSHFGYNTSEDPYTLYSSYVHVAVGNLQPGDVLLFANTFHPGLSHAAIYIGGGQMVGADNFALGVHVDAVWDSYWGPRFVTAVRIVPYSPPSPDVQAPSTAGAAVSRGTRKDTQLAGLRMSKAPRAAQPSVVVNAVVRGARARVATGVSQWIKGLRRLPGWIKAKTATGLIALVARRHDK
jgi:hypothetical protein